jgi:hypothetical protein
MAPTPGKTLQGGEAGRIRTGVLLHADTARRPLRYDLAAPDHTSDHRQFRRAAAGCERAGVDVSDMPR